MGRKYICIDLKSFYASVECVERGLDPLTTNLVVADEARTEKTICLAVTPSLKAYGIKGRARLFEVISKVKQINYERKRKIHNLKFEGKSYNSVELAKNPRLELDYIKAVPRMKYYMKYSTYIYNIYLKYVSKEDILVYSIDEIFCDVTDYLNTYKMDANKLATTMIKEVYEKTGITATVGIGTNLYLAKVAMDIVAKHCNANEYGVRIAELNEKTYREKLWDHTPLTDFWRVGAGYTNRLNEKRIYTMGDIARCSIENEDLIYKILGVNAELLIDHSWGYEPCTIKDIKAYKPKVNSISSGQVLKCPYDYTKTKLIVKEMTDALVLDLVEKELVTDQIVLTIGYDVENMSGYKEYDGEVVIDRYGRKIPKHAHGSINLECKTSSTKEIMQKVMELFDKIINKELLTRRINITANRVINEKDVENEFVYEQLDFFTDYENMLKVAEQNTIEREKEKSLQKAVIDIKKKYGKNMILKGMNYEFGGTMIERNSQVGGHRG